VTLSVLGTDDGEVPEHAARPLAQLAVHRAVQEALANVLRHAPGARCEVVVDARTPGTLVVSVRNGPPAGPPATGVPGRGDGLGLVGMRERADLTDAHLEHGPQPDGGWLVALTLRTDGPARPATPTDPADSAETEGASA